MEGRTLALIEAARRHDVLRPLAAARIPRLGDASRQGKDISQRRDVAADGRHRMSRIETVCGGRALFCRRIRTERAVALEEEIGEPRARQRPLMLVAPAPSVDEPAGPGTAARAA